ncbi:YrdB family protein [Paenibacillus rhizovicinus]|uniref:YrdB family protein n=1 Tax=Paenibacillus rhizovicinus TaxID=2704463 RepID=A0A6C0P070_9BACL|nr:YrdB family protein [Paenibacillus rhizovicinus]QHW31868.1 YrdB family protein [Paenibacillus rhizovicinus]
MLLIDLVFFLLELCALAAFCYWGFKLPGAAQWVRIAAGVGTPALVAVLWGTFVAPKASMPVSSLMRFAIQLVIFGTAAAALYDTGRHKLGTIFMLIAVVELVLSYSLKAKRKIR